MWTAALVLLATAAAVVGTHALVAPASKAAQKKVQRVAVVGAGIAGLSLAHALENSPECASVYTNAFPGEDGGKVEVSLFDSRPSLDLEAGAGIQLNGGMSVLKKINPLVQKAVAKASLPLINIRSRAKPWFDDGSPFQTLLELNLEDVIRKAGGKTEEELIVDDEIMCYTIMRGALQETLLQQLPPTVKDRARFGKTLKGIKPASGGDGIMCDFDDGSTDGPFDLVVGCDGVKSAVKEYVESGQISIDSRARERRSAIYSGIRIQYAVKDGDPSAEAAESAELRQYFGDGAYALGGVYGAGLGRPSTKCAFLIFRDDDYIGPFKRKSAAVSAAVAENADWTQDVRSKGDARSACLERVRRSSIPESEIGPIIQSADRFFELGVYFHNPFSFSGWSRQVRGSGGRFCVLSGDAAHTMPPFLGQGSNQAIQDAYCLAKQIFEHNTNVERDQISQHQTQASGEGSAKELKSLLKEYEKIRWSPTAQITAKASFLGYLETGQEGFLSKFRDAFFWSAGKVGLAEKVFLDSATPNV